MHVDVPEHGAVHQSAEEEVDVAHQHQRQAHLHQGFVVLEVGAAYSWRKYEDGLGASELQCERHGPHFHTAECYFNPKLRA